MELTIGIPAFNEEKNIGSIIIELKKITSKIIVCDLVAHSGGWNPTVHLHSQSRGTVRFDEKIAAFVPNKDVQNASSVQIKA